MIPGWWYTAHRTLRFRASCAPPRAKGALWSNCRSFFAVQLWQVSLVKVYRSRSRSTTSTLVVLGEGRAHTHPGFGRVGVLCEQRGSAFTHRSQAPLHTARPDWSSSRADLSAEPRRLPGRDRECSAATYFSSNNRWVCTPLAVIILAK